MIKTLVFVGIIWKGLSLYRFKEFRSKNQRIKIAAKENATADSG